MKLKSLYKIFRFTLALPFLGLASCEMTVDVDLPPHESKLVVNCLLTPDSLVTVRVYKSLGPLDRLESVDVKNAKVILLENGIAVDTLPFVSNDYSNFYRSANFRPQALKTYTLLVTAPGFPNTEASCTIPGNVPILKASIRDSAGLDEDGGYYSRLLVTFQDPGSSRNFYNLSGQVFYSYSNNPWDPNGPKVHNSYPLYFFSDLNDVEDAGDNGMLMKDDLFNGRQYELALNFYPPYGGGMSGSSQDTLLIAFKNVTPEYYDYYRKLQPHLANQGGDIFGGEPVVMPSNIKNGYGLFAGYSQDTLLVIK
jgi:hypothetical protein